MGESLASQGASIELKKAYCSSSGTFKEDSRTVRLFANSELNWRIKSRRGLNNWDFPVGKYRRDWINLGCELKGQTVAAA